MKKTFKKTTYVRITRKVTNEGKYRDFTPLYILC